MTERDYVLGEVVVPEPAATGLDAPFWSALREERIVLQYCPRCERWLWGPEWICPHCHSFDLEWRDVPSAHGAHHGTLFAWERVWHPTHPDLRDSVPYVIVLVELPLAGGVRLLGNRVGPAKAPVVIGADVRAEFEHHDRHTLLQWRQLDD